MNFTSRPLRFAVAGAALGAGLVVGAVGVMAIEDGGTDTPPETTVTTAVAQPVDSSATTAPTTAATSETEAPSPTIAAGFENYRPGDALPAAPAAPVGDEPVQTVPGPNGPIFPDGYVDPIATTVPPSTLPPPATTNPCSYDPTKNC